MADKTSSCLQAGCGCLTLVGIVIACVFIVALQSTPSGIQENPAVAPKPAITNRGTKTEGIGTTILYSLDDAKWSEEEFRELCRMQKRSYSDRFLNLVVFDKAENIAFPINQVSGHYADEKDMKHIIAIYQFNGDAFSEITFYHPGNMWKSKPRIEKLP